MENLSRYYTLLRDPTRRKIVEILGSQDKIGFKELRETLGLGVGTVYYHLDMLSGFVSKDKQHKYMLSDQGRILYRVLKEGNTPAPLEIGETLSHRVGKWLFLSGVFTRTVKPLVFLPVAMAIMVLGAVGSAYAKLDPALFFYFPYSLYSFTTITVLYFFNWLGLFFFAEFFAYVLYRRVGNELQLFACLGFASFPVAAFPFVYMFFPESVSQYVLLVLQVWSLLLISAALCFGKGLRLDKAVVISLAAMYVNMAALFVLGRFT